MFTLKDLLTNPSRDLLKYTTAANIAAITKIDELYGQAGTYDFEPMPDGSCGGIVVVRHDEPEQKFFVKRFAADFAGRSANYDSICEFFYYKLLEHLGYGPKCHITQDGERDYILISQDLNQVKTESGTVKKFETHKDSIKKHRVSHHIPNSPKSKNFYRDFMASEILIRLLELDDVHMNTGNMGTVVTTGPKTSPHEPKVKTKIVDFTLPHKLVHPEAVISFQEITDSLREVWRSDFLSRLNAADREKEYQQALQKIFCGDEKHPPIMDAISVAYEECVREMTPTQSRAKLDRMVEQIKLKVHSNIESVALHSSL